MITSQLREWIGQAAIMLKSLMFMLMIDLNSHKLKVKKKVEGQVISSPPSLKN